MIAIHMQMSALTPGLKRMFLELGLDGSQQQPGQEMGFHRDEPLVQWCPRHG